MSVRVRVEIEMGSRDLEAERVPGCVRVPVGDQLTLLGTEPVGLGMPLALPCTCSIVL